MNLPEIGTTWRTVGSNDTVSVREVRNDRHGWRVSVVHEVGARGTSRVTEWPLEIWELKFKPANAEEVGA